MKYRIYVQNGNEIIPTNSTYESKKTASETCNALMKCGYYDKCFIMREGEKQCS